MYDLESEMHLSYPDSKGLNQPPYFNPIFPKVIPEGLLGPLRYIQEEAYDGIFINSHEPYQVVYATPTFPYFDKHITIYGLNVGLEPCQTTIKITPSSNPFELPIITPALRPETCAAFFELVRQWSFKTNINPENIGMGINLSGWTHTLTSMSDASCKEYVENNRTLVINQTRPVVHLHAFERPANHDHLVDFNLKDSRVTSFFTDKLAREMNLTGLSENELKTEAERMLFDEKTWQQWRPFEGELLGAIENNPFLKDIIHSTVDRLRSYTSQPPYGFEICTRFHNLEDLLNNGPAIFALLTQYETIVASHIPFDQYYKDSLLRGYNLIFLVFYEDGFFKLLFAPCNDVRAGPAERLGFLVNRTKEKI